eukprot:TRINITY_DN6332_c0_g3_i5.p1 TRINITY_DN6332_c0_g3~~TRINITY_DN6332_c0_g3_i5.p1  ORF type:complete len:328 (+),score=29.30 TRINITY_DN6332_c0_g3_i5:124-984(+)
MGVPLMLHSELVSEEFVPQGDSTNYYTFLETRPAKFEQDAIRMVIDVLHAFSQNNRFSNSFGVHIAHLGDSASLEMLSQAQQKGLPITVETCAHYLIFNSEKIQKGQTQFKCMPPIRDELNQRGLLKGIEDGFISMVSSDHSPAPLSMKELQSGDFIKAWGGISGIQYLLPATWTSIKSKFTNLDSNALLILTSQLLSVAPSKLIGKEQQKGIISESYDADLVVWDPKGITDTSQEACYHKHKLSPYRDLEMLGRVKATFVEGRQVFQERMGVSSQNCGELVLRNE